jgi:alkylation response protein AidB-like acyl-CoA dehydrogenase
VHFAVPADRRDQPGHCTTEFDMRFDLARRLPSGVQIRYRPAVTTAAVDAARNLAATIRDAADATERGRRVPPELVAALARAGLFRLCVPRALGGGEADVATLLGAIEEVARADGSTGWVVMIGATTGLVSAFLPDAAAREIYGCDANTITGGVVAPRGKATAVAGGYRVSGRWAFASGCQHCAWLMGGCLVVDDGKPDLLPSGAPNPRLMIFPSADAEIVDTWTVSGMCGSGSHDIAVRDLIVPRERAVSLVTDRPRHEGPLYAFPLFGLLALGISAVATGIARTAIDELVELAGGKTPSGSRRTLAERTAVQAQVADAEATLESARALVRDTVGETWEAAKSRGEITPDQRARLRLAATHATRSAARATDLMYDAGGGTSIYATSRLQRCFRDVHVATQHVMVAPASLELAGRLLLGLETDTAML